MTNLHSCNVCGGGRGGGAVTRHARRASDACEHRSGAQRWSIVMTRLADLRFIARLSEDSLGGTFTGSADAK